MPTWSCGSNEQLKPGTTVPWFLLCSKSALEVAGRVQAPGT
jgi:hypothetical protein